MYSCCPYLVDKNYTFLYFVKICEQMGGKNTFMGIFGRNKEQNTEENIWTCKRKRRMTE